MNTKLYTNTGKFASIVGLVVTTLAVSYVSQNSTKIVDGAVAISKDALRTGKRIINSNMTDEVEVWSTLPNGEKYDTGMRIRESKIVRWLKTH